MPRPEIKALIEALIESLEDRIPGLHLISFLPKVGKRSKKDKSLKAAGGTSDEGRVVNSELGAKPLVSRTGNR